MIYVNYWNHDGSPGFKVGGSRFFYAGVTGMSLKRNGAVKKRPYSA